MRHHITFAVAVSCLAVTLSGCIGTDAGQVAGARVRAATTSPSAPACVVPGQLRGQDVTRMPVSHKLVALTFDAGANADAVRTILDTLDEKNVKATFFLTGNFVKSFPVKSARIGRSYLVGNHTATHPDLTTLDDEAVRTEIRTAQQQILNATGQDPRRFFRFPFGAVNSHLITMVNNHCYVPFRWTVDTLGWKGTSGGMTRLKVVNRVLAGEKPGEIVLMHVGSNPDDGSMLDAAALPAVIRHLRADGYSFVSLARVMSPAP